MNKDKLLQQVGERVRKARISAGLNQEDLEDHGISWKHYQRIETGITNTSIRVLYKLAKAFKCHPKDFLP